MALEDPVKLALMADRRFPPLWSVDEEDAACFIVRDHEGKSLAYVYFRRGARPVPHVAFPTRN